jgi:hypothetical protein
VLDLAKLRARAECDDLGPGWEWSRGRDGVETCVEVMPDAGRVCHDERDCAGECAQTSVRFVGHRRFYTGRCTRRRFRTGCGTTIGETDRGWVTNAAFVSHCR